MELFKSETRISDLIKRLEEIQEVHGNLKVTREYNRGGVDEYKDEDIRVKYIRLPKCRERIIYYADSSTEEKGEKVLSI